MAKFTAKEVADAITDSNGILAQAARNLDCTRQTIYNYINKYASVRQAAEEARETNTDFVESKLMEGINAGNPTLIIFYLKTIGKNRGYVERHEWTGKDGAPIETRNTNVNIDAQDAHDAGNILRQLADLGAIPSEASSSDNDTETE